MPFPRVSAPPAGRSVRRRRWAASGAAAAVLTAGVLTAPAAQAAPPVTEPTTAPSASATKPTTHPHQRRLDDLVSEHHYPAALGSFRNAQGGAKHFAAGVADVGSGAPVLPGSQVRIASNTKAWTATVVLQLVQEGRIALDAPVETYLPGLVRGQGGDGREITIRHLLQQTSGLPDYDTPSGIFPDGLLVGLDRYFEPVHLVEIALEDPAYGAPGAAFSYSNTNYVLAGLVVEEVTGRPFAQELSERIIEPLGLEDTYWPAPRDKSMPADAPRGYWLTQDGTLLDVTEMDPSWGWAAGQLISTPGDVNEFWSALLGGELLGPEVLAEMKKTVPAPGLSVGGGNQYGLGIMTIPLECGVEAWGHGGDVHGYQTRNAVTVDGRSAAVTVTRLSTTVAGLTDLERVVEAALCE